MRQRWGIGLAAWVMTAGLSLGQGVPPVPAVPPWARPAAADWPYPTSDSLEGYQRWERPRRVPPLARLPRPAVENSPDAAIPGEPMGPVPMAGVAVGASRAVPPGTPFASHRSPRSAVPVSVMPVSVMPVSVMPPGASPGSPGMPPGASPGSPLGTVLPTPEFPSIAESLYYGGRIWTQVELLAWAGSGQHLPPMITTGNPITPQNLAGKLFTPETRILFPHDRVNNEFRPGFRLSGGGWLDPEHELGLEGDFFFLRNSKKGLTVASDANGNQIIARPFVNAVTGIDDAILVAYPGLQRGAVDVQSESWVIGGGVHAVLNGWHTASGYLDGLVGYRYFGLFDEVSIKEFTQALAAAPPLAAGERLEALDRFRTFNHFHGGVLGLRAEQRWGVMFFGGRATVALGAVRHVVDISGRTVLFTAANVPTATAIGRFALPSNIGRYQQWTFAVLPEVSVRTGVQLTQSGRLYVGYNWMYLSNVVRAGEQIEPRINPIFRPPVTLLPGPQPPVYSGFRTADYWLQGLSFGLEVWF